MAALRFACPSCQATLQMPEGTAAGALVRCPKCTTTFRIGETANAPTVTAPPPSAVSQTKPPSPAPKTFYNVDLRKAKFREFLYSTPWLFVPFAFLVIVFLKLIRFPFPGTTDDPPVATLAPFEVDEAALPAEIRDQFEELRDDFAELGFHSPIFHAVDYPLHATRTYWATFVHESSRAWGRIHCRIWSGGPKPKVLLFPMFFSLLDGDDYLVTSGGKPDMVMPDSIHMVNQPKATPAELWDRHEKELRERIHGRVRLVQTPDLLRRSIEQYHGRIRDYLIGRGIFKPLTDDEKELLDALTASGAGEADTSVLSDEDRKVFIELQKLQKKQTNVWMTILTLAVTLGLFALAFGAGGGWNFLWVLIPVILFHELGHFLAMRWFGYQNLRMFFIPFFGAAVMGRHYNAAGWKKAMVALMGPVPGIVVGGAIGAAGLYFDQPKFMPVAFLMLILNGFNLLPLLPFDGGWVVHAVLFSRHPLLDILFRLLTALAILARVTFIDFRFAVGIAVVTLLNLRMNWHVARTAQLLRRRGVVATSPDALSIPPEAAGTILAELRPRLSKNLPPKMIAQQVVSVFETLNARPPGILASIGLLALHAGSFVAAVLLAVLFIGGMFGGFARQFDLADRQPPLVFEKGAVGVWKGAQAPAAPPEERVTIVAAFADQKEAKETFTALQKDVPPAASLRWFGQSLFLTLPKDQKAETDRWTNRLRQHANQVIVDRKQLRLSTRIFCTAANEEEARRIEEELREHIGLVNSGLLLPPWSPAWQALPDAKRGVHQKARRTLLRLQEINNQAHRSPEVRAQSPKWSIFPWRRPNEAEFERQAKAYQQALKAEKKRLLENIRREGPERVDPIIVGLWGTMEANQDRQEMPAGANDVENPANEKAWQARFEKAERERNAIHRQMAERMGALPLAGDKPKPGGNLEAAQYGTVRRQGLLIAIEYVSFYHPGEGLSALAEWLVRRGCFDVKYGFEPPSEDDESPENE